MKKLIIAAVIMGLLIGAVAGCQALKSALCSPSAQEVANAADFVASADSILAFLSSLAPSAEVTAAMAAIKIAKSVFDQIKAGICVTSEQESTAKTAIQASQAMAMKMGYKP